MKNRGLIIALITVLSIIAIGIVGVLVMLLKGNFGHIGLKGFGYNVSNELIVEEQYDAVFDEIWVDSDAGNILFQKSKDEKIHVTIYGDEDRTTVEEVGSRLQIKTKAKKCFGICFNVQAAKVEVQVPESFAGKFDLKNRFGDTEVEEFEHVTMDVENNYGNIDILAAKKVNIKEDCGDVKIGEVEDATIKNNFGDIKIDLVTNYVNLKNSCGDIKINEAKIEKDSFIEDNMGSIKIYSLNEVYVDAKTSLGDIKMNTNYRTADVTLKIDNDCGDIKVEN